jgi:chorismate mutase
LKKIADYEANILTINQTIPINGVASLTISIEVMEKSGDIFQMIERWKQKKEYII